MSPQKYREMQQSLSWKLGSRGLGKVCSEQNQFVVLSLPDRIPSQGDDMLLVFHFVSLFLEVWPHCLLGTEVIRRYLAPATEVLGFICSKERRRHPAQEVFHKPCGYVMKAGMVTLRPQVGLVRKAATMPCAHCAFCWRSLMVTSFPKLQHPASLPLLNRTVNIYILILNSCPSSDPTLRDPVLADVVRPELC